MSKAALMLVASLALLAAAPQTRHERQAERDLMVLSVSNLAATADHRNIDPKVLAAMRQVPRHLLVPEDVRAFAYQDRPLPIGHEATISQPTIVASMK